MTIGTSLHAVSQPAADPGTRRSGAKLWVTLGVMQRSAPSLGLRFVVSHLAAIKVMHRSSSLLYRTQFIPCRDQVFDVPPECLVFGARASSESV